MVPIFSKYLEHVIGPKRPSCKSVYIVVVPRTGLVRQSVFRGTKIARDSNGPMTDWLKHVKVIRNLIIISAPVGLVSSLKRFCKMCFFTQSEWWIIGSSARSCSQAFVKVTSADLLKRPEPMLAVWLDRTTLSQRCFRSIWQAEKCWKTTTLTSNYPDQCLWHGIISSI